MPKFIKLLILLSLVGCANQLKVEDTPLIFEPTDAGNKSEDAYIPRSGVYPIITHPSVAPSPPPVLAGSTYSGFEKVEITGRKVPISSATEQNQKAMEQLLLKGPAPGSAFKFPGHTDKSADAVLKQLKIASMAFSVPETVNLSNDVKVMLIIDPSKTVKELTDRLAIANNKTSGEPVLVSKIVEVQLIAPDFDIAKSAPERQAVADTAITKWEWLLNPKKAGTYPIELSVNAIVSIDGEKTHYHINTFNKTVIVEVTNSQMLMQWLEKYWQWIFATLLIPLGKFLWTKYSSKD